MHSDPTSSGYASPSVWITDAVAVTALGPTLTSTWRQLLSGASAISSDHRETRTWAGAIPLAAVPGMRPVGHHSALRRLVGQVLDQLPAMPSDTRVVTATTKSGIDNLERRNRGEVARAREMLLADLGRYISSRLGFTHQGVNVSAACASSTIALGQAAGWIRDGHAEVVLVCGADLLTEFVVTGFEALKALSPNACRPFDRRRRGLTLGEGAAAMVLMSPQRAKCEGRRMLAGIAGWGAAGDAVHMTAPDRRGRGLMLALEDALAMAGIPAEGVNAVHAHGTGTRYNDMMEITAFGRLFKGQDLHVYSVKGALGHTLGAAGIIEAALSVQALADQVVPGTVGCLRPEAEARTWIHPMPQKISHDLVVSTNSGFGGINAALCLTRGETV